MLATISYADSIGTIVQKTARLNADIHPRAHRNLKMMATMKGVTMVAFLNDLFTSHASVVARHTLGDAHEDLIESVFAEPPGEEVA